MCSVQCAVCCFDIILNIPYLLAIAFLARPFRSCALSTASLQPAGEAVQSALSRRRPLPSTQLFHYEQRGRESRRRHHLPPALALQYEHQLDADSVSFTIIRLPVQHFHFHAAPSTDNTQKKRFKEKKEKNNNKKSEPNFCLVSVLRRKLFLSFLHNTQRTSTSTASRVCCALMFQVGH